MKNLIGLVLVVFITLHDKDGDVVYIDRSQIAALAVSEQMTDPGSYSERRSATYHRCTQVTLKSASSFCVQEGIEQVRQLVERK